MDLVALTSFSIFLEMVSTPTFSRFSEGVEILITSALSRLIAALCTSVSADNVRGFPSSPDKESFATNSLAEYIPPSWSAVSKKLSLSASFGTANSSTKVLFFWTQSRKSFDLCTTPEQLTTSDMPLALNCLISLAISAIFSTSSANSAS